MPFPNASSTLLDDILNDNENNLLPAKLAAASSAARQASYVTTHLNQLRTTYRTVKAWHTSRTTWRVTFPENSELAGYLRKWLYEILTTNADHKTQRFMEASLYGRDVNLFFADKTQHTFQVGEHTIAFRIGDPDDADAAMDPDGLPALANAISKQTKKQSYIFTVRSMEARDALVAKLEEVVRARMGKRTPNYLRHYTGYGEWERTRALSPRTPSSLVLGDGQYERIVDDVKRFEKERERYAMLGIPYHRGYLFYGPPGTGKTSLAHVLASNLDRDLYTLSLNVIDKDAKLHDAVHSVARDAMLLIEDVDIFSTSVTRESTTDTVTLHGLLQVLDGLDTPDGLIVILTTNHKERLDPALTRPGRVDLAEELGLPEYEQVARLFKEIYGESMTRRLPAGVWSPTRTMSTYVEVFKRTLNSPEDAVAGLIEVEQATNIREIELAANEEVEKDATHNV